MFEYSKYKIKINNFDNSQENYPSQDIIIIRSNDPYKLFEVSLLKGFSENSIEEIESILNNANDQNIYEYPELEFSISTNSLVTESLPSVKSSILITNNENLENKIKKYLSLGFDTFKIKFSKQNYIRKIKELENINTNTIIRADFNNDFSLEEAKTFLKNLEYKFEFIEGLIESETYENYNLLSSNKHSLCIDVSKENLAESIKLIESKLVDYVAIKPKLLGAKKNTLDMINRCFDNNIQCYISSSFETQLGLNQSLMIAKYLDDLYSNKITHGFGTIRFMDKSVIPGISLKNGFVYLKPSDFKIDVINRFQTSEWQTIRNVYILEKLKNAL
tara:strand:+ start:2426 stop:3424 length:999 start_codon:yes stop_codon:yes gene_type:complete